MCLSPSLDQQASQGMMVAETRGGKFNHAGAFWGLWFRYVQNKLLAKVSQRSSPNSRSSEAHSGGWGDEGNGEYF